MSEKRLDTDKRFCSILFDVMEGKGVKDVVCSPGSRNAPLLIAAASRDSLSKYVAVDERCAAFMALGMSLVSRRPVALVCTSGTALLNYAPAVAEAFYQSVPLIVVSADRPEQWIDQDDSQTLRQFEAMSNFVKKSYEIPALGEDDAELQWYVNRLVNDAMIEACGGCPGPVHINVRLGEPLGGKRERIETAPRLIEILTADTLGNKEVTRKLGEEASASRIMLVAGFMPPDSRLHRAVAELCRRPNVVAMAETLSNLHLGESSSVIDPVLTSFPEKVLDEYAPDLVISLGGALVSRKLKEYLRRNRHRCRHWTLGRNHTTSDCFMSLTRRIELDPARFLHGLAAVASKSGIGKGVDSYSDSWLRLRKKASDVKDRFVEESPWSELKIFDIIMQSLPASANLFLSNGTSVRYAQIINRRQPHASYCNRGVSGIDGSVSTAVGGAIKYKGLTVLVTGDLSMAYDIGSLSISDVPERMRVIVIDNQGGGIFRFIPTTSALPEREDYFCAPPKLPLRHLAEGYGWQYHEATDEISLRSSLEAMFSSRQKGILRVICDGEASALMLRSYMNLKVE